eukprot:scaffold44120_cov66-Cyclotella_meneghiniana.AAC.4
MAMMLTRAPIKRLLDGTADTAHHSRGGGEPGSSVGFERIAELHTNRPSDYTRSKIKRTTLAVQLTRRTY